MSFVFFSRNAVHRQVMLQLKNNKIFVIKTLCDGENIFVLCSNERGTNSISTFITMATHCHTHFFTVFFLLIAHFLNVLLEVHRAWQAEPLGPPVPLYALALLGAQVERAQPQPRGHQQQEVDRVDAGAHHAEGLQHRVEDVAQVHGQEVGEQRQPELKKKIVHSRNLCCVKLIVVGTHLNEILP